MRRKNVLGSIITGMAVLLLSACAGKDTKQTNQSLTLCVDELINAQFKSGFEEFRTMYPDVELHVEVASEILPNSERINTRILAGEGPDLLLMASYGNSDVYKMMSAQAFAPLDEFMETDSTWKAEDYVKPVLDAGVYEGRQMIMPLSYTVRVALTTQENLDKAGISLEACRDMASFLNEMQKFAGAEGMERLFLEPGRLIAFPEYASHEFLNYKDGKLGIDAETLRQTCEAYKGFYAEDVGQGPVSDTSWDGYGEMVAKGEAGMCIPISNMNFWAAAQNMAAHAHPLLWPFQNDQGETTATIMHYAGIRANSENRQNAWNMLKILMGDTVQAEMADKGSYSPVLKKELQDFMDEAEQTAFLQGGADVEAAEIPQDIRKQYQEVLMNPGNSIFETNICIAEFRLAMEPFYEGTASYDACMKEFEKFIRIYLTE